MRLRPPRCIEPFGIEDDGSTALLEARLTKVPGAILIIKTRAGRAEATRMERVEAGQSRWRVRHAWGTETFEGTVEQAVAYMKRLRAEAGRT